MPAATRTCLFSTFSVENAGEKFLVVISYAIDNLPGGSAYTFFVTVLPESGGDLPL
jgi:hypothetical protein